MDHLFRDYWVDRRIRDVHDSVLRSRRVDARARQELRQHATDLSKYVEDLEEDVGRLSLLLRVLLDACIKKGVVTHDEFSRMIGEIDMLDGVQDGRLDPKKARHTRPE
jgi:hypothetical protein